VFVVLHPRHKLHYFKNAGWPQGWIDTARAIVEAEFARGYASRDVEEDGDSDPEVRWLTLDIFCMASTFFHQQTAPTLHGNTFDSLPALSAPRRSDLQNELERYLATDPEEVADVLLWWFEQKHIYPRLYHMALDYLTIPRMPLSFVDH
jgi:hypothetical protein